MEGGGNDGVGSIGSVHDFLNGVADPAAPIAADCALLQLVGMPSVRFALAHAYCRVAVAARLRSGQGAAMPAQKFVSVLSRQVIVDAKVRMAWVAVGLP